MVKLAFTRERERERGLESECVRERETREGENTENPRNKSHHHCGSFSSYLL